VSITKPGRALVGDRDRNDDPSPKQAVSNCSAHGCPLPGSIRPENGDPVCSVHFLSDKRGWAKATAVIDDLQTIYAMARKASSAGVPMAINEESAALLFAAAKASGVKFNDAQREIYRRAGMKLRAAGALVEASIASKAVEAAITKTESNSEYSHEREIGSFDATLMGLTNNLRYAA